MERARQLPAPKADIARDGVQRGQAVHALLDIVSGLAHPLILDVRQVRIEMRLGLTTLANPLQHHMPHGLLGFFAPAVARYQVQAQVDRRR